MPEPRSRRRRLLRVARRLLVSALVAGLVTLVPTEAVWASTSRWRHRSVSAVPRHRIGIVFGAGLFHGRPSPFLDDRIAGAVRLYRAGRVQKLLMTGDNSLRSYDEVTAMKADAVGRGVRPQDITLDYAGFSTYDSCYRARKIFGITSAILITQRYHLPRAIFTCRRLGVRAEGYGVADWTPHRFDMPKFQARELLSTAKALLQIEVLQPKPRLLGPPETVN